MPDSLALFTGKQGNAEVGITKRIHFIYERATRKFKADLSLWLAWMQYCRQSKSHTMMSKVSGLLEDHLPTPATVVCPCSSG